MTETLICRITGTYMEASDGIVRAVIRRTGPGPVALQDMHQLVEIAGTLHPGFARLLVYLRHPFDGRIEIAGGFVPAPISATPPAR